MIGGHGIAQHHQGPGVGDVLHHWRGQVEALEIGRLFNIGGTVVPGEGHAPHVRQVAPEFVPIKDPAIFDLEKLFLEVMGDERLDLLGGGPDLLQVDRLTVGVQPHRLKGEIDVDMPDQGESHHQHGRGQKIGLDPLMDAGLEVPVSRKHRGHIEIMVGNGFFDSWIQGTAVADAGGAPETRQVEPQGLEIGHHSRILEILDHHLGARRKGRLDKGRHFETARHGLFGQQSGAQEHEGVRGVGAGGNGSDDHTAIHEFDRRAVQIHNAAVIGHRLAPAGTRGLRAGLLVELGDPADLCVAAVLAAQDVGESRLEVTEHDAVLGPGRTRDARLHCREIQLENVGVFRRFLTGVKKPVFAGVGLHEICLLRPVGQAQIVEGLCVHRKETQGCPELWGHVGDGGPVGHREGLHSGTKELHEFFHNTVFAQHLGDGEDKVGGRDPLLEPAAQVDADHRRDRHIVGLAQHDGLGLDTADTPAHDTDGIDHGSMRIEPHQRVGKYQGPSLLRGDDHHPAEMLQVHLMADARTGRNHLEIVKALLGPLEQGVAFAVALILLGHVAHHRILGAEVVHLDGMIHNELSGNQGVDVLGIAPQGLHGIPHGGQVHHRGNAGKILHQHSGRMIGNLHRCRIFFLPAGDAEQMLLLDNAAVHLAQQILHQDPDGERQPFNIRHARGFKLLNIEHGAGLPFNLDLANEIFSIHSAPKWLIEV